ncbi:MAG: bifunctional ornithine acetyltransferase/N-acetylglutamate synthase [Methanomicrobiales archaeon]|nr:bifunctional ornithine acetyltransferase/N-acetylglutamate synthase [Methanomicrobiales archaeon]
MKSICAVDGVSAGGIKERKYGLALIRGGGTSAGVFTSNRARAPCIDLMIEQIKAGRLEAVIANSGCANAYTGKRGYEDAQWMATLAGEVLGVDSRQVGVASTGVIGRYLDRLLIEKQCRSLGPQLERSEVAEEQAARAIMTTDLVSKHALSVRERLRVGGICKGSGMIAPRMGTMIAFLYTDAEVNATTLHDVLRRVTRRTFNRVVVDGDTSTNDIVLLTATGEAGVSNESSLESALEECCRDLGRQIASDGEGATKLIEVQVKGAPDEEKASDIARSIVSSPLVKTAVYGEDPNWGRVVAAAGNAGVDFDPYRISLWIGEAGERVPLVEDGVIVVDLARAKSAMKSKKVTFEFLLSEGEGEATAWGCDLTEGYVRINGRYTT